MSEPTKEQIEEARTLSEAYLWDNHEHFAFTIRGLAQIIAKVNNDALELAALQCHKTMMLYRGSDAFDDAQQGRADGAEECRDDIRAMKVPT